MPDEYTREEIRDAVWQATLGVPCDAIARGWGRHSASSVYMMLLGMAGDEGITHTSALMDKVAAELDQEERFTSWREAGTVRHSGVRNGGREQRRERSLRSNGVDRSPDDTRFGAPRIA